MAKDKNESPEQEILEEKKMETENTSGKKAGEDSANETDNVEMLGKKLMEMNDKYLRLSAEFDNYRKRTLKEKMELTKSAGEQLLMNILPVVDNFERALKSMDTATDVAALKAGVDLIYANFKDFLGRNGVKEIEATGCDFNTDVHEAVTLIPAPTPEMKGKVIDCVQKGYFLNDKVIRFAKVVVGE